MSADRPRADGTRPTAPAPQVSTAPAEGPRRWWAAIPRRLGRARTSTVVLAVLFVALGILYLYVRPETTGTSPARDTGEVPVVPAPLDPTPTEPTTTAPTTEAPAPGTTTTPAPTPTGTGEGAEEEDGQPTDPTGVPTGAPTTPTGTPAEPGGTGTPTGTGGPSPTG
ncbi:hypothetical protein [Trujillonella humicola]|uniref:hypothetical protein n=1 Tax=Trujillonella humicola TaxID=3383699 RepID=UPI0039060233